MAFWQLQGQVPNVCFLGPLFLAAGLVRLGDHSTGCRPRNNRWVQATSLGALLSLGLGACVSGWPVVRLTTVDLLPLELAVTGQRFLDRLAECRSSDNVLLSLRTDLLFLGAYPFLAAGGCLWLYWRYRVTGFRNVALGMPVAGDFDLGENLAMAGLVQSRWHDDLAAYFTTVCATARFAIILPGLALTLYALLGAVRLACFSVRPLSVLEDDLADPYLGRLGGYNLVLLGPVPSGLNARLKGLEQPPASAVQLFCPDGGAMRLKAARQPGR